MLGQCFVLIILQSLQKELKPGLDVLVKNKNNNNLKKNLKDENEGKVKEERRENNNCYSGSPS